jgi:hypothetical protein
MRVGDADKYLASYADDLPSGMSKVAWDSAGNDQQGTALR